MKFDRNYLPHTFAALGIAAAAARLGQMQFGVDGKGLLIPGHPLDLLVWALTAVAALLAVLSVRKLEGSELYADNFGPSHAAAIGCTALMGGIASTVFAGADVFLRLDVIRNYLGMLAVPLLFWLGICRIQGKQPFFLFHGALCLFLTVHTVSHYQTWCARPMVQNFFFPMAASISLALFAYYQTAFDVGLGKRRMQLGVGLLGSVLCLAAAAGGEDLMLYVGGAAWMLTGLCRLTPVPKPEPEKKEE